MDNKIEIKVIKIGLVGDSWVGKKSICKSYVSGGSNLNNYAAIGSTKYETKFKLKNGNEIKLFIWDSNGQERFHSLAINIMKNCHGVIIVSSLSNKKSFDNIQEWKKKLDYAGIKSYAIFGNKSDYEKDKWEITTEEAENIAAKLGLAYFETSCLTWKGINEGFTYVVNEVYENLENKNDKDDNKINLNNKEVNKDSNCVGKKKSKK